MDPVASFRFATVRPKSWESMRRLGKELRRWAFRGQGNPLWPLTTGLERAADRSEMMRSMRANREEWSRIQFQRRAHHYLRDLPGPDDLIEWLALLQHHGGPTRLLDFTRSFYIATFFAIESARESAVWAVNVPRVEEALDARFGISMTGHETVYHKYRKYLAIAEESVRGGANGRAVLPIEPTRLNERLSVQQGVFLFPTDLTVSFAGNLAATFGLRAADLKFADPTDDPNDLNIISAADIGVIKILVSEEVRRDALSDLEAMNTTSASLFPGLDGFARSLQWTMENSTRPHIRKAMMALEPAPDE